MDIPNQHEHDAHPHDALNFLVLLQSRWFVIVVLPLLWAVIYLPNLGVRDLRNEEGRRATPAREMLATGNFVVPTLYGDPYLNKPPLYFWVVAAVGWLHGGVDAWATRLPSALAVLGCVLIAAGFAPRQLNRATRALAALLLMTTTILYEKGILGEIDVFLSMLVIGALAVWWHGYRCEGHANGSWLGVGALLALAVLAKGPGGLFEFYLPVVAFLAWERRLRRLFTLGHVACVILYLAPTVLWLALLHRDERIDLVRLMAIWREQLGVDHTLELAVAPPDLLELASRHYLIFVPQVLLMAAPWCLLAIPMALPRIAAKLNLHDGLRRFLVCGVVVPVVIFWVWPFARPRHIMVVVFPLCVLAASLLTGLARRPAFRPMRALAHWLTAAAVVTPLLLAAFGIVWAMHNCPEALPTAVAGSVACAILALTTCWLLRSADPTAAPCGTACVLATCIAAGQIMASAVYSPWKAPTDPTRLARLQLPRDWARDQPLLTTRTFPLKGNDFFNLQFYLSTRLTGVKDCGALADQAPCLAIVTAEEAETLTQIRGGFLQELARMRPVRDGGPALRVVMHLRELDE